MTDEFFEKEQELGKIQRELNQTTKEVSQCFDHIMETFEQHYPPLSIVPEVVLTIESMEAWLNQRIEEERR